MKIVHICNYYQPQLGYQDYFLPKQHIKQGHDVRVITSDRYFPFPDYEKTVQPVLGPRIYGAGESLYEDIQIISLKTQFEFSARVLLKGLLKTVRSLAPDVVVCHGVGNFNTLRILKLKKELGFKLVVDDHMLYSEENRSIGGKLYYLLFDFKKIERYADKLVGVADQCVEYMVDKYKFKKEHVEMIPLGADSQLFAFNGELKKEFRKQHAIPGDAVVITYTGKLTFKKGPHQVCEAAARVAGKLTRKTVLLFIGNFEEEYKQTFTDAAALVPDTIQVINLPAVKNKELVQIYSASDIAVWPRQGSMSMIEASSCSLPIICCDFLKERYKNENGIPIREDNPDDLASALLELVNNEKKRKFMGSKGRELIEQELSWDVIARKFIEF